MADNQFQLILQAAELIEEQRSGENVSEEDTDLECEEEEADTQSDSGLPESELTREQQGQGMGRKRTHSEMTTMTGTQSPTALDAKGKLASNLHNEREKERRKDLKLAVHKLRNQLKLRKTKKATTISVLKAAEQEIKDLLGMEAAQSRELADLHNHHKHLTWKLETLLAEEHKEGRMNPTPPVLTPPCPSTAPITSVAPVLYMPPTPSAPHSPSVPSSPLPQSLMIQAPQTPTLPPVISPSRFPYGPGLPFSRFPLPSLMSPNLAFPMAALPHGPLSVHPRPLLMMPSASPPSFTLPPFLPHPPTAPGHLSGGFLFPSAVGTFPSQLSPPPSLLLSSVPPPGLSQLPFFQQYLPQSSSTTTDNRTALHAYPSQCATSTAHSQTLEASRSASPLPRAELTRCPSQLDLERSEGSTNQGSGPDDTSEHLIDVETPDLDDDEKQECERVAFLDLRPHHYKQRKKQEPSMIDSSESHLLSKQEKSTKPINGEMVGPKNGRSPPALVNQSGKNSTTVSQIIKRVEPVTRVITEDMFTSALEKHGLYFDNSPHREGGRCQSWAKREKQISQQLQPSPSIIDLPRLPTVICS